MKPSSLPRAGALALALAFSLTGCGLFTVQDGVAAKAVKVDIVFGAKQPSPQPSFLGPGELPGNDLPPLPPPPVLPPPPPDTGQDKCPPTSAIGARDEVVSRITAGHEPQGQEFDMAVNSQIGEIDPTFEKGIDTRILYDVQQEPSPFDQAEDRRGFQYFIKDVYTGTEMQFLVLPGTEDEQNNEGGLYLKTLRIPSKDLETTYDFIAPSWPYMKVLDFPIEQGTQLVSETPDLAFKRRVVTNPANGETVADVPGSPSVNSITMRSELGDIDNKVQVCADLAGSYRVALDIKITGDFDHRIVGTFWIAPQYGGWPIKDDYIMFGDLLDGVFSHNIMELPPAQCEDGLDNDGDGRVDFGGLVPDPQCTGPKDNDESR